MVYAGFDTLGSVTGFELGLVDLLGVCDSDDCVVCVALIVLVGIARWLGVGGWFGF